ncbi:DUF4232 domain-containing protein [Streptomyces sp. NBC_01497]|uniref:DUF4232 domain-containing protein n=1 Tax=Streptomyces sp. NBC_01497 TaxID=2903885 RepID=UPI002E31735A|nr:DUF4232 domain-containing protein [Streptomyces sp. NBC_01497]
MFSMRTPRARLLGAATSLVLGALSLTACTGATGVRDEGAMTGAAAATSPSPAAPAAPATKASGAGGASAPATVPPAAPATAPGASRPAADALATKAPSSAGDPVTCEGSNTKVVAAPLNRPVNHMLLTVTNTGSRTCYLYGYPALRFGDAQAVPPVVEDSHPQAVVTLNPGESGYASVGLSAADGSGSNGHTEKALTVYFHGRSGHESVGAGAHPPLPAKGTYIDDSLDTTYWQQSMDDALTW